MKMKNPNNPDHLEELQIGFLLGDLSAEEETELAQLAAELGCPAYPDDSLALALAGIDASFHSTSGEDLPEAVRGRLMTNFPSQLCPVQILPRGENNLIEGTFGNPTGYPAAETPTSWVQWGGWAAAAAILCFWLGSEMLGRNASQESLSYAARVQMLERSDSDKVVAPMKGLGEYSSLDGNFIWSDSRQEGYLQLSGLPVNNPAQKQYQLWIVDPARDEAPVDGGVFDITSSGMNIIPIDAKLQVTQPKAFVITLEQPGGVVKSRQEIVVGIGSTPYSAPI